MKSLKEEYNDKYLELSGIASEAKKLNGVRVFNGVKCISDSESIPFLLNRVESLELYHTHTERKLKKIREFANNPYLEGVESTTSYTGGYAQCLRDLKKLLEHK